MSNKQTTAVEFLIEKFRETIGDSIIKVMQEEIEKAKAIERKQIEDANIAGMEFIPVDPSKYQSDASGYFTSTFITE